MLTSILTQKVETGKKRWLDMLEKHERSGKGKEIFENIFLFTKQFVSQRFCGSSDSLQETW